MSVPAAKHSAPTKGPWTVLEDTCSRCQKEGVTEWLIPEITPGYHAMFCNEADARLCAAAPDLLEAVTAYLEWGPMTGSDRDLFENKFREAVRRALGEDSK